MLSLAAAELAGGALEQAQALLRHLLADQRVAPLDKARAQGLLGDVLDDASRYSEALMAYTDCNETLRHLYRGYASGTKLSTYADQLIATINNAAERYRAPREAAVDCGADISGHVFLLGFPRSGTTLLEVVLDGHPRVASLDEHELLIDGVRRYMGDACDLSALESAGDSELQAFRKAYWNRVREAEIDVSGKVFVDKYPMSTLKLPLIARLFPNAKILFACRDPREVVLACFRRRFRMNAATYEFLTLPGAAALYDKAMVLADSMRPAFGAHWRVVRYESLVADFAAQTRSICEFLGLEWIAGMEDFATRVRQRERSTPSTAQLARGLDRSRTVHWKHYNAALEPVLPLLARWVQRFEYL